MNLLPPDRARIAQTLATLALFTPGLTPAQNAIAATALLQRVGIHREDVSRDLVEAIQTAVGALTRGHCDWGAVESAAQAVIAQIRAGDVAALLLADECPSEPSNVTAVSFIPETP